MHSFTFGVLLLFCSCYSLVLASIVAQQRHLQQHCNVQGKVYQLLKKHGHEAVSLCSGVLRVTDVTKHSQKIMYKTTTVTKRIPIITRTISHIQ